MPQDHPFAKEIEKHRLNSVEHDILPWISHRWSPRSMSAEEISDAELMSLFEAARWAPSSYNNQPWHFLYAKRNSPEWALFFDLMGDFNQGWTKNAAVLLVVLSARTFSKTGKPSRTHSFDTGAAWMAMAIEATSRGLVIHGMEGFDYDKAYKALGIPEKEYQVEAMVAIGKRAPREQLSPDLQEREMPTPRRPVRDSVHSGRFPDAWKSTG